MHRFKTHGLVLTLIVVLCSGGCGHKTADTPAKLTTEHGGGVESLMFIDSNHVLTAGENGAKVWNVHTGQRTLEFGDGLKFNPPVVSRSGELLAASTATDHTDGLMIWSLKDGKRVQDFRIEFPGVQFSKQVSFHPSGNLLAFGMTPWSDESARGVVKTWNLTTKKIERTYIVETPETRRGTYHVFEWVGFTPDGEKLIAVSSPWTGRDQPGCVVVWDTKTGRKLHDAINTNYTFSTASITPDGRYLITASGLDLLVWDLATGQRVEGLNNRLGSTRISVSPDGTKQFTRDTVGGNSAISRFPSQEAVCEVPDAARLCVWHPHGDRFATAHGSSVNPSAPRFIAIRDASTGAAVAQYVGHPEAVREMAFSPDGRFLAGVGGDKGHLRVWDVK